MLLIIENGISGGITHAIHKYPEANNKHMKNYDKNKDSSYLMYLDANNLYIWAMSQKLHADSFNLVKKVSMLKIHKRLLQRQQYWIYS